MTDLPFKPILVNDNDVLSGRGLYIARHPGNERFRTLIKVFRDDAYCQSYSIKEKRAVAKEVMVHIHALDPPGRFLKLERNLSYGKVWKVLSEFETMQKTCQALRDCNRQDRSGYATTILSPIDVVTKAKILSKTGQTIKQRAFAAASKETEKNMLIERFKRSRTNYAKRTNALLTSSVDTCFNPFHSPPPPMMSSGGSSVDNQYLQNYSPNSTSVSPFSSVQSVYHQTTLPSDTEYRSPVMSSRNGIYREVHYPSFSPFNNTPSVNVNMHTLPIDTLETIQHLGLDYSDSISHNYQERIYPRY